MLNNFGFIKSIHNTYFRYIYTDIFQKPKFRQIKDYPNLNCHESTHTFNIFILVKFTGLFKYNK